MLDKRSISIYANAVDEDTRISIFEFLSQKLEEFSFMVEEPFDEEITEQWYPAFYDDDEAIFNG